MLTASKPAIAQRNSPIRKATADGSPKEPKRSDNFSALTSGSEGNRSNIHLNGIAM